MPESAAAEQPISEPEEDSGTRLARLDAFFGHVIDLIPPSEYGFPEEVREKLREYKHQLADSNLPKSAARRVSKRDKHRLAMANPDNLATVSQIQAWWAKMESSADQKQKGKAGVKNAANESEPGASSATREVLVAKLHNKLEDMKRLRVGSAEAWEEKKRQKRRLSKLKFKQKKKEIKVGLPKSENQAGLTNGVKKIKLEAESKPRPQTKIGAAQPRKKGQENQPKNATTPYGEPDKKPKISAGGSLQKSPAPEIRNKDGKLVFSKFDFGVSGVKQERKSGNKKKNQDPQNVNLKGRDYKRLFEKVKNRNEKLEQLKQSDPEKAKAVQENIRWTTAMQKAQGEKVKDDPQLLAKAIKRKEKIKERSKQKWGARERTVTQNMNQKQEKRQANLQKRKDAKVQKGVKKAKNKGRFVPKF